MALPRLTVRALEKGPHAAASPIPAVRFGTSRRLATPRPHGLGSGRMLRFILRRLLVALLVAVTVLTLSFMLTRLSGDLAISIAGANATQADVELIRRAYGLERPLVVQFFDWVGRAAIGDLGESYFFKDRVANL